MRVLNLRTYEESRALSYEYILNNFLYLNNHNEEDVETLGYLWNSLRHNWDTNSIRQMKEGCEETIKEYING